MSLVSIYNKPNYGYDLVDVIRLDDAVNNTTIISMFKDLLSICDRELWELDIRYC